jgi:hypothetical protein
MGDQDDLFSNPIAPTSVAPQFIKPVEAERSNLSNEDFRKLLMTPRTGSSSSAAPPPSMRVLGSVRSQRKTILNDQFKVPASTAQSKSSDSGDSKDKKPKKKSVHAAKEETDDTL